ncbi:MAG: hypothetical protein KDA73_11130 [Rhodobacteraceae bacterium]|nr:hypothetical protein [Paracoccaceae bacterium]
MSGITLTSPLAAAILLLPSLVFAAMAAFLVDAPAEWGEGALIAWTAIAACLLAGSCLADAPVPLPWVAVVAGFVAVMTGGPPGLAVAAVAVLVVALPGSGLAGARWLPVALALVAALVSVRRFLA